MGDDGYFDYAATAPPYPEALRRFEEVSLRHFGNPSSSHEAGKEAREALEAARAGFLERTGFSDGSLIVTSGATEANNLVLRGVLEEHPEGRLLLAADAHPSAWFARELFARRTDILETGPDGRISPDRLEAALKRKTVLVSVVHAGNETGVVQDLGALGAVCARRGVMLHADGAQALGRLPLSLAELPITFYTFSVHKFGGPRGIGGAFVRDARLRPQLSGGGQEGGARGGTPNVAGLAAGLVALDLGLQARDTEVPRLRRLAARLSAEIRSSTPDVLVNSDPEQGLPGLVSLSFPNLIGEEIVVEMNLRGFAISAGSACGSGRMQPSRPVLAMGRSRAQALGSVRISMGRLNTEDAMLRLAAALRQVVEKQKALA